MPALPEVPLRALTGKICLLLGLALSLSALGSVEGPLGWRVNGKLVLRTTAEFAAYLKEVKPGSIKLLELSGHGTRLYQSMDDFEDGHVESTMWLKDGRWLLLDKDDRQPDPEWASRLKRALWPQARVYFFGCQTGLYDASGLVDKALSECIARAFSQEFQVTTIACPEFVYYPDAFPNYDDSTFSNPSEPPTEGFSTAGGLWNIFERGRWVPPLNPAEVVTFKFLRRPVIPAEDPGATGRTP